MRPTYGFITRAAGVLGVATLLTACNDTTGANAHSVSLSTTTKSQSAAPVAARLPLGPSADVVLASGANGLTVSKAQVVLGKIELEPGNSTACSGAAGDGCPEMELDPVLIDLPLDGTTKTDLGANVPAGTYRGVEMKVFPVSGSDPSGAVFLAANPGFSGVSIHAEGTYNGQAFVYNGSVDAEIEMEFSTPITLGSGSGSNLTMFIDVGSWFTDSSGNILDPSSGANASVIADNIKRSFKVFKDDDRNGVEDAH